MRQIRVAMVTYAIRWGGMENFILRLSNFLSEEGFIVEIITTEEQGEYFGRISEYGLKARYISGLNSTIPLLHAIKVGKFLRKLNYDIILLNHALYAQASISMLRDNTVVIPILHNDIEAIYKVGCANSSAWNAIIGVSPKLCEEARRRVPGRNVIHMPHGIEIPSEASLQRQHYPKNKLKCIYAGRLEHDQKGVFFLPSILKGCLDKGMDIFLNIAGDGPDSDELKRQFSYLKLDKNIFFWGTVESGKIYELLEESHLLILPSFYEGLGIVLLEAMACGCIPVASRLPGITDAVIEDGRTGFLVDIADIQGFVQAIDKIYRNPEMWNRISLAGQSKAKKSFSIDKMGKAYSDLITNACNGLYPLRISRKQQKRLDLSLFTWRDLVPLVIKKMVRTLMNKYNIHN